MNLCRKTVTLIIASVILLGLVILGLSFLNGIDKTKIKTVYLDQELTIDPRAVAQFEPQLIAPYKTMDVFVSEVEEPGFEFTAVGGYWNEFSPQGTNVEVQVRTEMNGVWSDWVETEEEEETENQDTTKKFAMAATNPANRMQYKVFMYGDGVSSPKIDSMEWSFIKSEKTISAAPPQPKFSSFTPYSTNTYLTLTAGSSGVISREQWGADESYRYLADNNSEAVLVPIDEEWYNQFADELKYSRVVEEDSNGDKYKWPLQYPEKVKKFVIHHTATTSNLDDPDQAIRDIYYYHAITRGWGDIGYNYIMDTNGKVYEGRYGGEGVIGAHSGPANNGSIGISVLGNYESEDVPEKVIVSLAQFIAGKSKIHDIAPNSYSTFRGEIMPNIFGHKDVMSTSCPGAYFYEKLPVLRVLAEQAMNVEKEKFIKEYDYQDQSDIYYLEMKPDSTVDVIIELENIGTKDWGSETFIVVNKNPEFEGVISFPSSEGNELAYMEESEVKSGETATFRFQIASGKKGETVYMDIAPVIDGYKKISDYKVLPVTVQQSSFKYEFVDDYFPGKAIDPNTEFEAWVKLKNTGNVTWESTGANQITLKTDHERDRLSKFLSPPGSTLGYLKEDKVEPGEIGTFVLNLKSPSTPGYYKEYFTPYVKGVTWMSDTGMYFDTTVYGGDHAAELYSISDFGKWEQGRSYAIWVKIRNLGKSTWTRENMKIGVYREQDLKLISASLGNESVAPGEVGTLNISLKVDENEDLGIKAVLIRPQIDGIQLLPRPIYFYYQVKETGSEPTYGVEYLEQQNDTQDEVKPSDLDYDEGKIRVRISYSGNPEISANGNFSVYASSDNLGTLSSGKIAKITLENGKYKIEMNGKTYTYSDPVRFGPASGTILRIDNYDHRPAWDDSINDNEYRGVLEVREVDGELVVINELPLEDYLKGLAEVPNDEYTEKIKAITIAARTYAKYYMEIDEKFPGKPYHLDDDPEHSQKYMGYGYEMRAPNIALAVDATHGEVVTYDGELVKTPYFNQSDGGFTKSAIEVWNWDAPFLVSVSDSYCDGDEFRGHGVGLSGCGARGMAAAGFNYLEILTHYYTGIDVVDLY